VKRVLLVQGAAEPAGRAELLVAAHRLYGRSRYETTCVTAEPGPLDGADSRRPGILAHGDGPGPESVAGLVQALEELHREVGFDAVLLRSSHLTGMLAPRLAARLGAACVTEVVDIRRHAGGVALVRRAGGGRLLVRSARRADGLLVAAIRPGAFPGASLRREATHSTVLSPGRLAEAQVVLVGRRAKDPPDDIRDAEILISGGGGALASFAELQRLAAAMGGLVAASRRAVDLGAAARAIQVGQSGRTVSPRLYMAIGIDGAGQHIEGLGDIESIISVNTNRHAPICSISDVVVEGDAREFIERLCRRITEETTAAPEL
jgi:electron transfer flavoprotein alpha subunit